MFFTSTEKQLPLFAGNFNSKIRKDLGRSVRRGGSYPSMPQHSSLEVFKDKSEKNKYIP